jgi:hypothetical protein
MMARREDDGWMIASWVTEMDVTNYTVAHAPGVFKLSFDFRPTSAVEKFLIARQAVKYLHAFTFT